MSYTLPGQSDLITPNYCGERIGDRADEIAAAQQAYQAATLAAGPAVNSVFIGNGFLQATQVPGRTCLRPTIAQPGRFR